MKNFKKFLTVLPGVLASIFLLCACSGKEEEKKSIKTKFEKKALIVYYSQSDKQNTATVAKWIGEQTKGKLFPITMKKPYAGNYFSVLKEAKKHLKENIKPEILPCKEDIASYDVIFIGSPVWFGTFAPPAGTFLQQYKSQLSGKTVIPFCTHGGGGAGKLYGDMVSALPESKVILPGLTMKGHNVVERVLNRGTEEKCTPDEVIKFLNRVFP